MPPALADRIAELLAEEKVVGLMQGRMEFGPRALGGRSIIGDARSPKMQSVMNLKIKFRESFRPFAPAVLREHVADWFELDGDSPYMLLVADVQPSRRLPEPPEAERAVGHREAERAALDRAGDHPRRLLGAHPDGAARDQPALLRHHRGLLPPHRLPGDRQHLVQRARRADRLHARGRLPLLHAHQHGRARARKLHPHEERAAGGAPRTNRGRRNSCSTESGLPATLARGLADGGDGWWGRCGSWCSPGWRSFSD